VPLVTFELRAADFDPRLTDARQRRFDQRLTTLHLHAGSIYPGGTGWRYGDRITVRTADYQLRLDRRCP
jgi:hypothetical protein